MQATTKDLRLHTARLLAAVDRGESIVITYRGRRRAVLEPWRQEQPRQSSRNPAFGIWADRNEDVPGEVRRLRAPRKRP